MNCVLWSMGDASLHGIGTSSVPASLSGVTHVAGLNCYLCVRTVPRRRLTNACSRPTSQSSNLHAQICRLSGGRLMRGVRATNCMLRVILFGFLAACLGACATTPVSSSAARQAPSARLLAFQERFSNTTATLIVTRDEGFLGGG